MMWLDLSAMEEDEPEKKERSTPVPLVCDMCGKAPKELLGCVEYVRGVVWDKRVGLRSFFAYRNSTCFSCVFSQSQGIGTSLLVLRV